MAREKAEEIRRVLGKNLKRLIQREYPSLESFALQNQVDYSVLNRLVNGLRTPSVETLIKIAAALEVSLNDLYPMKSAPAKRKPI